LPNELIYITIEKSATNPSLENAFCSTKDKKEWTHLERLEREHKSLIRLYHIREEQIVVLEIREMTLMKKLTRGGYKHNEMLFHHAPNYGKRGLGSFPEINKCTIPSSEIKSSFIKNIGSYCQHCQVTDHHIRECYLPNIHLPTIPNNSTMYENNYFLLSKIKRQVKARFICKLTKDEKKKLTNQLWVTKALVTHVQGPKLD
jgi:hypothetical protein